MSTLVPSILTRDPGEIREKISLLEQIPEIKLVHIDFGDGKFIDNEMAYPREIGQLDTRLEIEAHMMVQNPQEYYEDLQTLGAKAVFVHYEAFQSKDQAKNALQNAKYIGMRAGLAINPQTELEVFDWFMSDLEEAVLMGVTPGFQGQELDPAIIYRLESLRKLYPDAIIEVDGGLKLHNIERVAAHGATKLNVGSGIWVSPNPLQTIAEFLIKLKQKP